MLFENYGFKTTKDLETKATETHYAVGAFNFNNLEQTDVDVRKNTELRDVDG